MSTKLQAQHQSARLSFEAMTCGQCVYSSHIGEVLVGKYPECGPTSAQSSQVFLGQGWPGRGRWGNHPEFLPSRVACDWPIAASSAMYSSSPREKTRFPNPIPLLASCYISRYMFLDVLDLHSWACSRQKTGQPSRSTQSPPSDVGLVWGLLRLSQSQREE